MAHIGQVVNSVDIKRLKGLRSVSIDFEPGSSLVTGIFGPNGCGKSTVLHLLACAYQPVDKSSSANYKFSHFFLPTSTDTWQGSSFSLNYSYRVSRQGAPPDEYPGIEKEYGKNIDRWSPRYPSRPYRHVEYIGINTCVPLIEREKKTTRVTHHTEEDNTKAMILSAASTILNRKYDTYYVYTRAMSNKRYMGVRSSGLRYSALSMGAGEQRVFQILEAVYDAPDHALILIDEIDLLLHEASLVSLLEHLVKVCTRRRIQLVFTAHRHSVLSVDGINHRHIVQTPEKTICLENTSPRAITNLTGRTERSLAVYVEDDLAEAIVRKVAEECGVVGSVALAKYGSAQNAFTMAAAHVLMDLDRPSLFVLDGDVFISSQDRERELRRSLSGDDQRIVNMRARACVMVAEFGSSGVNPEEFIHRALGAVESEAASGSKEIEDEARRIQHVGDNHDYVNRIITNLGYERNVGLTRVVDAFAATSEWVAYTAEVRAWVVRNCEQLRINHSCP